jgi:hypothetical protein
MCLRTAVRELRFKWKFRANHRFRLQPRRLNPVRSGRDDERRRGGGVRDDENGTGQHRVIRSRDRPGDACSCRRGGGAGSQP